MEIANGIGFYWFNIAWPHYSTDMVINIEANQTKVKRVLALQPNYYLNRWPYILFFIYSSERKKMF